MVPAGTVIIVVKEPLLPTWRLPALGMMEVVLSWNVKPPLAGQLAPTIITSVPAGPVAGDSGLRDAGAETVNVAEAVLVPAVAVIVWAPGVAVAGMVIIARNEPPPVVAV